MLLELVTSLYYTYSVPDLERVTVPPGFSHVRVMNTDTSLTYIWVSPLAVDPLLGALRQIHREGYNLELHSFWGCYNPRDIRGRPGVPSLHTQGLACDWNADTLPQGTQASLHPGIVRAFKQWGWSWGGDWEGKRRDPMHFEWRLK